MAASSPQLRAAFTAPAWSLKHVYLGRPCAIRRSPPRPGEGYGLPPRGDGQPGIGRSGSKRGEAARGMAQGRGGGEAGGARGSGGPRRPMGRGEGGTESRSTSSRSRLWDRRRPPALASGAAERPLGDRARWGRPQGHSLRRLATPRAESHDPCYPEGCAAPGVVRCQCNT